MIIRQAKLKDAEGIARVHVNCWRTTYKNIVPDEYLDSLSYEKRTELWKNNISRSDNYVYVAETKEGQIIGFADGGKRVSNEVEHSGDVTSIYILEHYQGRGIGRSLLDPLFRTFVKLGYQTVFVEVLEDNKSKFFYEKLGASLYTTTTIEIHGKLLQLLTYQWTNFDPILNPS
ncbi:GNAT family acetyltransferase [Bacillus sp. FJAT-18017]|uniref:GNAT family N-acetyltransferase n=1 Tax=Bacillus sp. FJAT-18017 TaxID=1705566 RepID=UPI0006AEDDE8|nr:GNAT family N-acetyltransferase [Bacillus sp. FJAT-18017]ALC90550.1 GNAT family acetyltransferase [Bacillus sp. FJAT-18017]